MSWDLAPPPGQPAPAPANNPAVANFSWIGTYGTTTPHDNDALRRFDYMINRDNLVAVVAVNNGAGTPIPAAAGQFLQFDRRWSQQWAKQYWPGPV